MPKPRPQYLQRHKTRHGGAAWYVQIGKGPLVRVKPGFGEPGFADAYEIALTKAKAAKPAISAPRASKGTLEWAWQSYVRSSSWAALKPATRKQRDNIAKHVMDSAGAEPLSAIDRTAIKDGIERRSATPSAARNFLDTMRGLFTWLLEQQIVRADPTASIKVKRPKTEGFLPWNYEEILQFEKRWPIGTRQRVMLDVFIYTGLRRGDAARVGKQHVRDGVISIQTEKTGEWVHIPLLDVLRKTLEAGPTGDLALIATTKGTPMTKESLGNAFRDACRDAGIVDKSAHGLRKAAATRAADNGATEAQLEAIFGWRGGKMAYKYTQAANRKRLAAEAIHKLRA